MTGRTSISVGGLGRRRARSFARMRSFGGLCWVLLMGAGCLLGTADAQPYGGSSEGAILEATFRIDLAQVVDGMPVAVRYLLRVESGVDALPLKGVLYRGAVPRDLVVSVDDRVRPVLIDADDWLLTGFIPLDGAPPDTVLTLDLRYVVPGPTADARAFDFAIPVLYVDWTPDGAPEGLFTTEVRVPDGVTLTEVFPTVAPAVETLASGQRQVYRLQVVPSLLRLRGYRGKVPLLTVPRLVDVCVLIGLGILMAVGWRALRRAEE